MNMIWPTELPLVYGRWALVVGVAAGLFFLAATTVAAEITPQIEQEDLRKCDEFALRTNRPPCTDTLNSRSVDDLAREYGITEVAQRSFSLRQCDGCKINLVIYCRNGSDIQSASQVVELTIGIVGPGHIPSLHTVIKDLGAFAMPTGLTSLQSALRVGIFDCAAFPEIPR